MALTDSMFLFEITVEELTSFINCKEFCIRSQFADVFSIQLKDPNELRSYLSKRPRKHKIKRKPKIRSGRSSPTGAKVQTGQSILFANNADTLIANMKQYPMELSLWSKVVPDYKIGSTHIPWSAPYYEYLNKLHRRQEPSPVCIRGDYNVFDEFTSKRMAVIKLNVKLSYLKDKITTQFRSISQENQQTFIYTGFDARPNSVLSTITDRPINLTEETGIIKTIYSGEKRKAKTFTRNKNRKTKNEEVKCIEDSSNKERVTELEVAEVDDTIINRRLNSGIVTLIKSDINLDHNKHLTSRKSKSCSSFNQGSYNILNYIFEGQPAGPFGNQVYWVGYFTVENEYADSPKSAESEKAASEKTKSSKSDEEEVKERYKFRICESDCPNRKADTQSVCSLDLPKDAAHLISVKKCDRVDCDYRKMREIATPADDIILLDLSSRQKDCCDMSEKVEEVVGGIQAKMKFGSEPCYCECECKFGFIKKTTFCNICGGYEEFGDEYTKQPGYELPFPCPIFHKLADKNKLKMSTSGSDTKKKEVSEPRKEKKEVTEPKREKKEVSEPKREKKEVSEPKKEKKEVSEPKREKKEPSEPKKEKKEVPKPKAVIVEKIIESEKETTKKRKCKKKDDRFKFNYGYTAPQIGHSRCAMPCTGTLGFGSSMGGGSTSGGGGPKRMTLVPKRMGWLWTAENIPGVKFRPLWKPGATHKHIVRLLKIAKNPGEIMAKKRKKDSGKVKRPLKRPLLTVQKKDGEYTVTMETMKTYAKPRTFNQYPYEDKPLVTYTIGRTAEENLERKKKKERAQRRLERLQRDFVQSAFKDMCQEICLKTYQQALGILPEAELPDCPCYPADPSNRNDQDVLDLSCSCSEDKELTGSDTDSDEWIVEFTPPTATFDPTFKSKKVAMIDNSSQYSYMDYRVKLLDRYGNPVPRYFKGPDGKQLCSDLGGFWGPTGKWLEINTDGYIGPDEKWAPNVFLGPDGEHVDAETGKFQAMDGKWLVVGVDGYVEQGKWKFYPKPKPPEPKKKPIGKKTVGDKKEEKGVKQSEATWSCFGSVSPKQLSKMGIVGHGHDKRLLLSTLKDMLAQGEDVKIPEPTTVPRSNKPKGKYGSSKSRSFVDRRKCKHATPSDKGIVAVDGHGNKIYFRLKDFDNRRPKDRMTTLTNQGISLSSFHVPCFHSFISSEMMKKQQYDRLVALAKAAGGEGGGGGGSGGTAPHKCTTASTQADYVYVV